MKNESAQSAQSTPARASVAAARPDGSQARKLGELTAEKIEMRITDMDWPVGTVIGSEADLLAEYGVSRAALREAIRLLEHHNVAYMRRGPGGGLIVAEPNPDAMAHAAAVYLRYRRVNVSDLFETRTALELASVRSAAEHIDEAGIARLQDALAHEAKSATAESGATIHDFHVVVAELTGKPALHLFINVLTQLSVPGFLAVTAQAARAGSRAAVTEDAQRAHAMIAEAIIAGDAARAQYRMLLHLNALAADLEP